MKKLFILAVIFMITGNTALLAQDIIDPSPLPRIDTSSFINRTQPGFILGWNWGSTGRALDQALNINTYHDYPFSSTDTEDSICVIEPINIDRQVMAARNTNNLFNAQTLYLKPGLELALSALSNFEPRDWNTSGAVFGFQNRDFIVGDTLAGKYLLYSSRPATYPVNVLNIDRKEFK